MPWTPRTRKASSIAISSPATSRSGATAPSRCSTSAWRKSTSPESGDRWPSRLSQLADDADRRDAGGHDPRHRGLHVAGAGARQTRRQARRHLGIRRRPLRDADRPARVRGRGRVVDPGGGDPVRAALGRRARERAAAARELPAEGSAEAAARHRRRLEAAGRPRRQCRREREAGSLGWIAAGLLAIVAAIALWAPWRGAPPPPLSHSCGFEVDLGPTSHCCLLSAPTVQQRRDLARWNTTGVCRQRVAVGRRSCSRAGWISRALTELAGTEGASNPFFSRDGQWVGFWSGRAHLQGRRRRRWRRPVGELPS